MTILERPRFVAIDSATLSKIAKDFWAVENLRREKARAFIDRLTNAGVYITITATHLWELLSHDDVNVANSRIAWLRTLPMISWIRPYNGHWFLGDWIDLLLYELDAVYYGGRRGWTELIESIRPTLLETGVGEEMFTDDPGWRQLRTHARRNSRNRRYIASIARLDVGGIQKVKLGEFKPLAELPNREPPEDARHATRFANDLQVMLDVQGDPRLETQNAARAFTQQVLKIIADVKAIGGDPYKAVTIARGVPPQLVTSDMTVGELGEIAI
jgi:hypothetical protein